MALLFVMSATVVISILWFKAGYDDMMFVPKPRDQEKMAKALAERFGSRVRLLGVPVVNRDVNGIVGYVAVPNGWAFTTYSSERFVFSFERFRSRPICLMTMVPWELHDLRSTLQRRG